MATTPVLYRYLQYLANFLPTDQREDILTELGANLQEEMDDRSVALGRPLTADEEAELLKRHGHPMVVAARYLPVQHLIGPPWIALYWLVLRLSLTVAATVLIVRIVLAAALSQASGGWVLGSVLQFPEVALTVFAWVTLAFATMDYCSAKFHWLAKSSWDPRKLPQIKLPTQRPQFKPMTHLAASILGLAFLVAWRGWRSFVPASTLHALQFSAAWHVIYQIWLAVAILNVVAAFVVVLRPDWHGLRPVAELLGSVLGLIGLRVLLQGAPWVMLADPARDAAQFAAPVAMANMVILWSILGTMVGLGIATLFQGWRVMTLWRRRGLPSVGVPHVC